MDFMNTELGRGSTGGFSFRQMTNLAQNVTGAVTAGAPSTFAQQHLFSTPCP